MDSFNGIVKLKVIAIEYLKLTEFSTRIFHNNFLISPYVLLDIDDTRIGRTTPKHHTHSPLYNEEFQTEPIENARYLHVTVFHKSKLPPDDFVANATVSLCGLSTNGSNKLLINLEPCGKIHLHVELEGQMIEG